VVDSLIIEDIYQQNETITSHILQISGLKVLYNGLWEPLVIEKLWHDEIRQVFIQLFKDFKKFSGKDWVINVVNEVGDKAVYESELLLTDVLDPLAQLKVAALFIKPEQSVIKLINLILHINYNNVGHTQRQVI
jgi:hypothetical protein